jgi:hypothetical protein
LRAGHGHQAELAAGTFVEGEEPRVEALALVAAAPGALVEGGEVAGHGNLHLLSRLAHHAALVYGIEFDLGNFRIN